MFIKVLMRMWCHESSVTCIAQVTFKFFNKTLLDLKQQLHIRIFCRLLEKLKWLVYKVERELCYVGWCGVRQGEMGYLLPQQDSISLTM